MVTNCYIEKEKLELYNLHNHLSFKLDLVITKLWSLAKKNGIGKANILKIILLLAKAMKQKKQKPVKCKIDPPIKTEQYTMFFLIELILTQLVSQRILTRN
ncbi:hypothetical protein HSX44_00435 [Wolbachia endosymbiont of Onchocerca gibsoni]|uniref:hypothetical protein n=1 Tax=Wolbachia endosymbiont of Onchocerca gibsoni TaxID=118986 RepID=UPI0023D81EE5|nr:hypothetical protein [Wolbachia endosymbiont of Onchocerca gibsoni]MDF0607380.1 hypothetical protein [Wolbachia endosymbiont of Onchocerca gibsoni]